MKTLVVDDLQVTSSETVAGGPALRGTADAHQFGASPLLPTDPNFDCTYGCTPNTGCQNCVPSTTCP
ncbi:MAG TPA: hypothetical protein VE871_11915 [Longimicrobium sp.]|nr:hypothetical protein [Longimicrobium sp.]